MRRIRDRVAGLDVHRDTVVACVKVFDGEQANVEKQTFSTTVKGIGELADWLTEWHPSTVVMEATGVYWKPVFYPLEGLFDEVWLVNAQHVKNVPGRKTDMSDAEWLADVAAHGMVRPSFVPPPEIRELREVTRYRETQIKERTREIQRLDKLLQDAGIKLSSVASEVWSKSSRAMIEALISGEHDPAVLADLAKSRMRSKIPQLTDALAGRFAKHHGVVARRILDHIDFLDTSIEELTGELAAMLVPFEEAITVLDEIPGWGRKTAEIFIAETGGLMNRFPSGDHFASWATVAPASHESAGKRKPAGTKPGNSHLGTALIEAARAAARTNTYLGATYRQIARRRGANKAAVAVARHMAVIAWHILTTGEHFYDLGVDYHQRRRDPQRDIDRLVHQLEHHGFKVTLQPAA